MDENNTQQSTPEHRRLLDALPFYVNGTLDAAERVWVEAYLKAHPEAAKELRLTEAFRAVVKASQSQVPEDVRIDRLLKAWAKEKPTPAGQAAPAHGWLGKLTEWWRQAWAIPKPLAGFAVAVLVAQMAVLLALLPVSDEAAQYRGAGLARPPAVTTVRAGASFWTLPLPMPRCCSCCAGLTWRWSMAPARRGSCGSCLGRWAMTMPSRRCSRPVRWWRRPSTCPSCRSRHANSADLFTRERLRIHRLAAARLTSTRDFRALPPQRNSTKRRRGGCAEGCSHGVGSLFL